MNYLICNWTLTRILMIFDSSGVDSRWTIHLSEPILNLLRIKWIFFLLLSSGENVYLHVWSFECVIDVLNILNLYNFITWELQSFTLQPTQMTQSNHA